MKVKQYPHYLYVVIGGEATQNDDGDWVSAGEPENRFISVCREETNGRGNELQVGGGLFYKYSSLVYLPKDCANVEAGTMVFVSEIDDGAGVRIKGKVLKFVKEQLHCMLWVN